MRPRRPIVALAAACLMASLMSSGAVRATNMPDPVDPCAHEGPIRRDGSQTFCRPGMNDRDALLRGGELRDDGLVHFRIAYSHDVDDLQKKAFQAAMALWNEHRSTTGFVFEDTTTAVLDFRFQRGAPSHLRTKDDTLEKQTCAAYLQGASYIWYSPTGMAWVTDDPAPLADAARIYAHELGHALNLRDRDPSDDSVMREGDSGTNCRPVAVALPEIQKTDIENAHLCACRVRNEDQKVRNRSAPRR